MNDNNYCLVSRELLLLLKWINKNNPVVLEKIVEHAWKNGFDKTLIENKKNLEEINEEFSNSLQSSLLDFFNLMEDRLKSLDCNVIDDYENDINNNFISYLEKKDNTKSITKEIKSKKKDNSENKEFFKKILEDWDHKGKIIH